MNEKTIKVSKGDIVLVKPKAGVRNNAALKCYEGGSVNEVKFMIEILPSCIKSHPFETTPIRQALDQLDIEEYDSMVKVVRDWITPATSDVEKKSE